MVPDELAGEVLRRLVRDLERETRQTGARVSLRCTRLLLELHRAAERHERGERSVGGSRPADPTSVEIGAGEAAARLECSTRWITHLAATGRIAGRQVGRTWLIDPTSLDNYARGSTAA